MKFDNVFLLSLLQSSLFELESVEAHGGMQFPTPRNVLYTHYCPHCANGAGVCGDGRNSQWTTSTEPSVTYGSYFQLQRPILIANGVVEVSLWFTVGHLGVFVMELCTNPGSTLTEDCFVRLNRDPTDVTYSPYLPEVPHIFFLPDNECVTKATEANPMTARFLIPENAVTSHAVLRYRWETGNSCSPSPYSTVNTLDSRLTNFSFTLNGVSGCKIATSHLGSCGTDCPTAACGGERFTNCADVAIHAGAAGTVVSRFSHKTTSEDVNTVLPTAAPGASTAVGASTTSPAERTTTTTTRSAAAGESTTTEPASATCVPGGPVVGTIADCRSAVSSFGGFDDFCRDSCGVIAAGEVTPNAWCRALSICDLTTCVATFWSNVCRKQ